MLILSTLVIGAIANTIDVAESAIKNTKTGKKPSRKTPTEH